MIKLPTFAMYALITPAITLGLSPAWAADTPAELAGATEQRSTQEQRQMPGRAQSEQGMSTADRARERRMAAMRAHHSQDADGVFLSSPPAQAFGADELMGVELKSQSDDETLGTISDVVIDERGQIAAVVVGVGEFLGLGQKNVAVAWNAIDRSASEDGDGFDLSVNTTKDALRDATEYKAEADRD